jgi:hypothetical protein
LYAFSQIPEVSECAITSNPITAPVLSVAIQDSIVPFLPLDSTVYALPASPKSNTVLTVAISLPALE